MTWAASPSQCFDAGIWVTGSVFWFFVKSPAALYAKDFLLEDLWSTSPGITAEKYAIQTTTEILVAVEYFKGITTVVLTIYMY